MVNNVPYLLQAIGKKECPVSQYGQQRPLSPKVGLDFDDTLQHYVAKNKKLTLVTLDQDFRSVQDIQVVSPRQLAGEKRNRFS